jgi:hypothetical protein
MAGNWVLPNSGDVLRLGAAASPQFSDDRPLTVRLIRIHDWATYEGWRWLDCYVLNEAGDAVDRRSLFVSLAGLRRLPVSSFPRRRRGSKG